MKILKQDICNVINVMKLHSKFFIINLIFAFVIYFLLISNQLVNPNDGLWEYSYYKAGSWSLSLGRWFWLYIDRLRFGISTEPLTSIIALSCFVTGIVFVIDLFELVKKKVAYLAGMLFLSSTVVCISLSYRFMSPTFGLAFLLSVLAVWIMIKFKSKIWPILLAGLMMALSMGLYQAYIGCTCILLVGYFLYALQSKEISIKDIMKSVGKALVSAVVGGGLYIGILNLHLKVFGVTMSEYNGASSYSVGNMIQNLAGSIQNTYYTFARYFLQNYFRLNVLQEYYIFYIALAVVIVILLVGFVKTIKISKRKALLYLFFVAAIPVASNAVLLVATQAWTGLLLTAPMALCFPIFLCLTEQIDSSKKKILRGISVCIMALMLYGNIYQVQIDQQAMLEGQIATTTMANDIIHDLNDEGYLDADLQYCVLGMPAGNEMFTTSVIYEKANSDAMFGAWYSDITCTRRSWQGVFTYLCGTDIEICDAVGYQIVLSDSAVENMAVYPNDGYIQQIGDIVVIKVSE